MKGYSTAIEKETLKNSDFRRVLYTGKYSQLVLMNLKPMEEIGIETHNDRDQFFRFEEGEGKVIIDEVEHKVKDGDAVIVPAGAKHNVVNTSKGWSSSFTRSILRQNIKTRSFATRRQMPRLRQKNTMENLRNRLIQA
jgi:mannose-6-phosphate isomerase-like protein (cupin superfamily)